METMVNKEAPKIVDLQYPFKVMREGKEIDITNVNISRLKTKHLEVIPPSLMKGKGKNINPAEVVPLVAAMCNLTKEEAGEIDFEDLTVIVEEMGDFLESATSQKIGKN